ncbi:TIGR04104 family putative zinc finger protein [Virgibacillus sp. Bac332]|nr:TIGR04104 family putative zinc finger protein [Virgibacillus sp. Bac332]
MDTLKRSFRMKMKCPYCEEANYLSANSRKKSSMTSLILLPLILIGNIYLNLSIPYVILIGLLLLISIVTTTPFMIGLSKEEEPLW